MKHITLKLTLIEARAMQREINADLTPIWGKISMDGMTKATLRRIREKLVAQLKEKQIDAWDETANHIINDLQDALTSYNVR